MQFQKTLTTFKNSKIDITTTDKEKISGKLIAVDKYSNIILSNAEIEIKRKRMANNSINYKQLGSIFIKGTSILSIAYQDNITSHKDIKDNIYIYSKVEESKVMNENVNRSIMSNSILDLDV